MQAGRELDAKVAECFGWEVDKTLYEHPRYKIEMKENLLWREVPEFSTKWQGMGVLVEEARKQGIHLMFEHDEDGFSGRAWQFGWSPNVEPCDSAPLAVALAFLKAKGR